MEFMNVLLDISSFMHQRYHARKRNLIIRSNQAMELQLKVYLYWK